MNAPLPVAFRILESLAEAAVVLSAERRVVSCNRAAESLLGVAAAQAEGRPLEELLTVCEPSSWRELFGRLEASGAWQGELRRPGSPEERRWHELTARPLEAGLGLPGHALLVAREASKELLFQQALSRSEEQLRQLSEQTHLVVVVLDERGTVNGFNPAASELTGIPRDEALGAHFWDLMVQFIPAERRPEAMREQLRAGILAGLRHEGRAFASKRTWEFQHRDGTRRWAEQIALIPLHGAQGPLFVSLALDVTERQRAEAALRESEEKFRTIAEQLSGVIFTADAEGRVDYVSPGAEQIFGLPPSQLTGRLFTDFLPEERRENARLRFQSLLQGGEPLRQFPLPMVRADGGAFAAEMTSSPWSRGGVVQGALGMVHDVSERTQALEQRQLLENQLLQAMKMEAVGRLAGGVAHDFNNYLTSIIGNVSLALIDLPPGDPLHEPLTETNKAAERAADLTRQLLAFSRKQIIEPRVVDLNELVGNLGKMLARLLGEDVDLRIVLAAGLCRVKVDPGQFEQVLVNLAVNARDAMPDGGLLVIETAIEELDAAYCSKHVGVTAGTFVRLSVSDTGHGLSPEARAHLFEPFFTTKEHGKGTGLGLATSYGAVQQVGGRIEVYSEPGKGTCFKLYLPCALGASTTLAVPKPARMVGGTETILLVEDEPLVRVTSAKLLARLGYQVIQAADGQEALRLAARHPGTIELLLTDVVMPGMNGRTLSQRLVEQRPEARVLFASGYTENVIVIHGVLEDGINFIGKPYSPAALATKIRAILDATAPQAPTG